MAKKPVRKNTPLTVEIDRRQLVIRIGIGTLAHAAAYNPKLWDEDIHGASEGPYLKITDEAEFAHDVMCALQHEEEDGSGPLSDLLDEACERAKDDGSLAVDYDWKPEKK